MTQLQSDTSRAGAERLNDKSLVFLIVSVFFIFSSATTGLTGAPGGSASRLESASSAASPKAALATAVAMAGQAAESIGAGDDHPEPALAASLPAPRQIRALSIDSGLAARAAQPLRHSPLAPRAPPALA